MIGDRWESGMREAVKEMARVLKQGRWVSLCYHDTSEGTWELVQDIFAEADFVPDQSDSSLHIDTKQRPMQQQKSDKVIKRDLVINFRNPFPGEVQGLITISGKEDDTTFNEKVRSIIREYLEMSPGSTKDRIYDEVVSHMVRSMQMETHNFEELLTQVADEVKRPYMKDLFRPEDPDLFDTHEVSQWYLKETALAVFDSAESAKEEAASQKMQAFITEYLKKNLDEEGVHYSDLFEYYIYSIKDKPRRPLADWLIDYFYKTESGTYRLPRSEEEELTKAEGRKKGTNRHIKRYIAYLDQGIAVPENERPNDATLAEWIRHSKRSGLFEQGKLIYEKGGLNLDNLPEEVMVNVEEDYQTCVRMIERGKK